ncbi:Eco57I restriction-modification methylase domain-containing protein [Chryseobacterium taklimakanense]|uniref:Eco57I restriction-modification methylase domain-containing protein n=1 Tax=Chryseobacterium taklimakanense TaxID=536441 RepID=UPI001EF63960|nr:TaqI-like C-terminal specificity domain-containing protein [Chryseobacterium taklimakanense]MCG7280139.1 Eco57I restriction-modification methylase domain-containing protein [Chryseobacterium taklimakanense]
MFQNAYLKTKELVETFKANESHYISPAYVEARVRQDFIDKLFTALGWDVLHDFQKNPFEQEVKVEKPQRQEGHQAQKRADYAFYLAPDFKKVQFFVEAKKPSRTLRQNRDDYFQTAKYGWNSQTGISILTDFEEIVMIDCRFKPDFDTILSNEIKYYKYLDLLDMDKFSEFYWLFSREAVDAGNLTKFVESLPQPKGKAKKLKVFGGRYQSIDDSFLDYIDDIRLQMAQAFYQNNPTLDHYDLTEATQRTIDRLVFIRFLEDKQIEPEDLMHGISTSDHPWRKFIELSKRLDAKYNGVVFKEHFIDKNAFLGANEELFKNIAQDLDHTNTPYDFNYIPIHILGNIYERFLGKIIVVEDGKARIELKPEVRKAGGVFYTPKYIVDYIVENTVGKKIADKKPKEIAKLKFADIACGSGSFLIGVYDFLLDYYKKYYNQNPDEAKKDGCIYDAENQLWVLSIRQKQQILLDNVFGVDIDLQATEVSQVSLFLKLLEDETMATANDMNVLFAEKILPDLSGNIKCGNSLIGYEIMDGVLEFGKEEMRKLNPFDFEQAFPAVFSGKRRGFDCIVGNPPYLKLTVKNTDSIILDYYKNHFQSYSGGSSKNLFQLFIERVIQLDSKSISYIVPESLLTTDSNGLLRKMMVQNFHLSSLVTFDHFVFGDATIGTTVFVGDIAKQKESKILKMDEDGKEYFQFDIQLKETVEPWDVSLNDVNKTLFEKIISKSDSLKDLVNFSKGMVVKNRNEVLEYNSQSPNLPFVLGNCMNRYFLKYDRYGDYKNLEVIGGTRDFSKQTRTPRILVRRTGKELCAVYTEEKQLVESTLYIGVSETVNLKFVLALVNSRFLTFYLQKKLVTNASGFPQILMGQLEQLPIPKITPENQPLHDALVKLVDQMLQAKKDEQNAVTDHDKNFYRNLTQSLDNRINKTVYQLYNLTDQEIALVEGN